MPASPSAAPQPRPSRLADFASQKRALQSRIDAQFAALSSLVPGSREHRVATALLLTLQDSLFLLTEIEALSNALPR